MNRFFITVLATACLSTHLFASKSVEQEFPLLEIVVIPADQIPGSSIIVRDDSPLIAQATSAQAASTPLPEELPPVIIPDVSVMAAAPKVASASPLVDAQPKATTLKLLYDTLTIEEISKRKLTELIIKDTTDHEADLISQLPNTQELRIHNSKITVKGLQKITSNLSQLKSIGLGCNSSKEKDILVASPEVIDQLKHLQHLTKLSLWCAGITAKSFNGLKHLEKLQEIDLGFNDLNSDDMRILAQNFPQSLEKLQLIQNKIGTLGFINLFSNNNLSLSELKLYNNKIDDRNIEDMHNHPLPKTLTELDLGSNDIGPKFMRALSHIIPDGLKILNLENSRNIGDEGIVAFMARPLPASLETLKLYRCGITEVGIETLANKLPLSVKTLELDPDISIKAKEVLQGKGFKDENYGNWKKI